MQKFEICIDIGRKNKKWKIRQHPGNNKEIKNFSIHHSNHNFYRGRHVAACSHFQNLTATGGSAHRKHYQYRTQLHSESLLQHSQMTWPTKRPGSHYHCHSKSREIPTFPHYTFQLPLRGWKSVCPGP